MITMMRFVFILFLLCCDMATANLPPHRIQTFNRTNAMFGGDVNGNNQRTISCTLNNLNEYSTVIMPGYKDVMGASWATNTVTVNGGTTDRKGEYFHKEITIANGSGPVWQSIQVTNNGVQVTNGYVLFPPCNQSPTYDYDGNLFTDGLWTYTWDAENRLKKVESVSSLPNAAKRKLEFGYDYLGRRIWSKISTNNGSYVVSCNTRFVYDGWNLVAELNATNNAFQRSYLWGSDLSGTLDGAGGIGGLVAIRDHGTGTYHFTCYDGNGNIMALVNAGDQSISAQYEYSPFGELVRSTGPMAKANPFRFSTKYWDEETGLVYYGYRFYSLTLGRWINRDPIDENGGNNLFGFVVNNPINATDPLGMTSGTLADEESAMANGEAIEGGGGVVQAMGIYFRVKNAYNQINDFQQALSTIMDMANGDDVDMGQLLQLGQTMFASSLKMSASAGILSRKPGKLGMFKGTDALRAENAMVKAAAKAAGLTKEQTRRLHIDLHGTNLSYKELVEEAKRYKYGK